MIIVELQNDIKIPLRNVPSGNNILTALIYDLFYIQKDISVVVRDYVYYVFLLKIKDRTRN